MWLFSFPLLSQIKEPEWKTKIFVEDAMGNKDSVTIGYTYGTNYTLNPDYGELDTQHVLDSVLDVRNVIRKDTWGVDIFSFNSFYLSKINIKEDVHPKNYTPNGVLCFDVLPRFNIAIYAKYQPVKITWDKTAWEQECHSGSWIVTDALTETVVGWHQWRPFDYECLAKGKNEVVWSFPTPNTRVIDIAESNWLSVFPTTDNRLDTMWIVQIATKRIDYFDTPCSTTRTDDLLWAGTKIYPNPSQDYIHIEAQHILKNIQILNIDGKNELNLYLHSPIDKIDISNLPPGLKIIEFVNTEGSKYRSKFIKL